MNTSFLGRLVIVLLSTAALIGLCWFVLGTKPNPTHPHNQLIVGSSYHGALSLFHEPTIGRAVGSFHNSQRGEFVQIEVFFKHHPPKDFKDLTVVILNEVNYLEQQGATYEWMRVDYTNLGDYSIISGSWESDPST